MRSLVRSMRSMCSMCSMRGGLLYSALARGRSCLLSVNVHAVANMYRTVITCMYVCVCVCMYVYIYIYIYIYVCVYIYVCIYIYIYKYVCMFVCLRCEHVRCKKPKACVLSHTFLHGLLRARTDAATIPLNQSAWP
jgi:hypothetical protein